MMMMLMMMMSKMMMSMMLMSMMMMVMIIMMDIFSVMIIVPSNHMSELFIVDYCLIFQLLTIVL